MSFVTHDCVYKYTYNKCILGRPVCTIIYTTHIHVTKKKDSSNRIVIGILYKPEPIVHVILMNDKPHIPDIRIYIGTRTTESSADFRF